MRYLTEDVPCGLVPIVSLAETAGVETPASRGVVNVACGLLRRDFWTEGRTLGQLGLRRMTVEEIKQYVEKGKVIRQ
jgi:opine dehydrogenase